jgi:predicted metal-dependent hydrolase
MTEVLMERIIMDRTSAINSNLDLIMAPEDVIDYVAVHELCHLKN